MAKEKDIYVLNRHDANVRCRAKKDGEVILEKTFAVATNDPTTGRAVSTGYTRLTAEEHALLMEGSGVYRSFVKEGLLVEQADIPEDLRTPGAAVAEARREAGKLSSRVKELEAEVEKLTAQVKALKEENGKLISASTPNEAADALVKF
jgi:hypothetical protein